MSFDQAAPCRHQGAPSDDLVNQVVNLLERVIATDDALLRANGISPEEFHRAFPAAIERIRGRWAASNKSRREFAQQVIEHLAQTGVIQGYDIPKYGDSTIYRLRLHDGRQVGLIQKGCPDGAHSSTKWSRPTWADELYLWWLCSSRSSEPGEHVWKGVARVRNKVAQEPDNQLDGVIFYNALCGTAERPCPKARRVTTASGIELPPPCVYVFPAWKPGETDLNWRGTATRLFPEVLLSAFGVQSKDWQSYAGYVGFQVSGTTVRTEITTRYGAAKASSVRG
jgi:hypothetical protein